MKGIETSGRNITSDTQQASLGSQAQSQSEALRASINIQGFSLTIDALIPVTNDTPPEGMTEFILISRVWLKQSLVSPQWGNGRDQVRINPRNVLLLGRSEIQADTCESLDTWSLSPVSEICPKHSVTHSPFSFNPISHGNMMQAKQVEIKITLSLIFYLNASRIQPAR